MQLYKTLSFTSWLDNCHKSQCQWHGWERVVKLTTKAKQSKLCTVHLSQSSFINVTLTLNTTSSFTACCYWITLLRCKTNFGRNTVLRGWQLTCCFLLLTKLAKPSTLCLSVCRSRGYIKDLWTDLTQCQWNDWPSNWLDWA